MSLEILKEAGVLRGGAPSAEDLALIHGLSKKELQAEEVYTFCVRLCDNEIDRDYERFTGQTLEELAGLFVGKSGGFDHQWSAMSQVARIYRTELVWEEDAPTGAGEPGCYLKGYAYMLRSEKNEALIEEIEGGIKKEVSVGCAVERAVCSICGGDIDSCGHVKGRIYGGKTCWADLVGARDAYEWSFVAVPAQRKAGVMKRLNSGVGGQLEYEAALGRKYLAGLRNEVIRLGRLANPEMDRTLLGKIAGRLDEQELTALKKCYEDKTAQRFTGKPQLSYHTAEREAENRDGAFLI